MDIGMSGARVAFCRSAYRVGQQVSLLIFAYHHHHHHGEVRRRKQALRGLCIRETDLGSGKLKGSPIKSRASSGSQKQCEC